MLVAENPTNSFGLKLPVLLSLAICYACGTYRPSPSLQDKDSGKSTESESLLASAEKITHKIYRPHKISQSGNSRRELKAQQTSHEANSIALKPVVISGNNLVLKCQILREARWSEPRQTAVGCRIIKKPRTFTNREKITLSATDQNKNDISIKILPKDIRKPWPYLFIFETDLPRDLTIQAKIGEYELPPFQF